jgi:hypothetical protein
MSSERRAPLVVTFADSGYQPLLQIWVRRLRQLGIERVKVFCLDAAVREWCDGEGVDAVQIEWSGALDDLWQQRVRIFRTLLAAGEEFIHSDIDAIWVHNPLRRGAAAGRDEDLLFSQGTVWPFDVHQRWGFVLCCGWFWAKPTVPTRAFFEALESDVKLTGDDQISVNRVLAGMGLRWSPAGAGDYYLRLREHLVQCWSRPICATTTTGSLSVALLPQREFQRLPEDAEHAIVKHFLTPKNCQQKLSMLQACGLI